MASLHASPTHPQSSTCEPLLVEQLYLTSPHNSPEASFLLLSMMMALLPQRLPSWSMEAEASSVAGEVVGIN